MICILNTETFHKYKTLVQRLLIYRDRNREKQRKNPRNIACLD